MQTYARRQICSGAQHCLPDLRRWDLALQPRAELSRQVSVCSHQLLGRSGRWNAAPRHPGLTQPGISHTPSLTSFSVCFIPLPTQCLLKSLLHHGKHETWVPWASWESSHNLAATKHRTTVWPFHHTHCRPGGPSFHLGGRRPCQEQKKPPGNVRGKLTLPSRITNTSEEKDDLGPGGFAVCL